MPKTPIDYSKACVYRLIYNDITYYVGSTTNMRLRKSQHRIDSNYEKGEKYNRPLYKFIRDTGGWNIGWSMILIETYPQCKTSDELRKYERHHYDIYKPSLNLNKPYITIEEVKERQKQYDIENKDKIRKETNCVCGGKYIHNHKARHLKTLKHMKYLEEQVLADV